MRNSQFFRGYIGLILLLLFEGCSGGPPEKPAPSVTVSHPIEQEVTEWDEYSGRLESPEVANVAARVNGIIVDTPFKEGSIVSKDDSLFLIDDRSFKAELASKEADLSKAKAMLAQAQVRFNRYEKIRDTKAISAEDYDQAVATLREAEADVAAAIAGRELAQLNLEWTRVSAPISGQVGKRLVTTGNIVNGGSGQMTQLTSITSLDPMYAYINVPERSSVKYRELSGENNPASSDIGSIPCEFHLENETVFRKDCRVDFFDNHIDGNTGTLQVRGVMPNPSQDLKPGMFIKMRIQGSKPYKALLISDAAVINDQNSRAVLVVNKENIVESRQVTLGPLFGKLRVISAGVTLEDRVIFVGTQMARPGTKVNPVEPQDAQVTPAPTPQGTPIPAK